MGIAGLHILEDAFIAVATEVSFFFFFKTLVWTRLRKTFVSNVRHAHGSHLLRENMLKMF